MRFPRLLLSIYGGESERPPFGSKISSMTTHAFELTDHCAAYFIMCFQVRHALAIILTALFLLLPPNWTGLVTAFFIHQTGVFARNHGTCPFLKLLLLLNCRQSVHRVVLKNLFLFYHSPKHAKIQSFLDKAFVKF